MAFDDEDEDDSPRGHPTQESQIFWSPNYSVSLYIRLPLDIPLTTSHLQSQAVTPATPGTPATPLTPQGPSLSRPLSPQQAGMRPIADYDYDDDEAYEFDTDDEEFDELEWQNQNASHFTVLDSSLPSANDST